MILVHVVGKLPTSAIAFRGDSGKTCEKSCKYAFLSLDITFLSLDII
jgi:hypothetical protein